MVRQTYVWYYQTSDFLKKNEKKFSKKITKNATKSKNGITFSHLVNYENTIL